MLPHNVYTGVFCYDNLISGLLENIPLGQHGESVVFHTATLIGVTSGALC